MVVSALMLMPFTATSSPSGPNTVSDATPCSSGLKAHEPESMSGSPSTTLDGAEIDRLPGAVRSTNSKVASGPATSPSSSEAPGPVDSDRCTSTVQAPSPERPGLHSAT